MDRSSTAAQDFTVHPRRPASIDRAEVVQAFRGAPPRLIDVGHSQLAYWRFGQGPDVLFVHGWPLNAATFRHLVPLLADRFTCHLVDLPGAGKTQTRDLSRVDVHEHVSTLQRLVTELGLHEYALLAQDSGGYVARGLAASDVRVKALVLGNTEIAGKVPWLLALYVYLAKAPGGATLMRAMMRLRAYRHSKLGFGACLERPEHCDGEFDELLVRPMLGSAQGLAGQVALLRNLEPSFMAELPEVHARIKARTRLIWGSADGFFPISRAQSMLGDFAGGADLCKIEGGRLFVHEERAEEFAQYAKPFLIEAFAS